MIMNSIGSALSRQPPKLVVLATWVLFAITLGMDRAVADLILLEDMDFIAAAWILSAAAGLIGAAIALRGWRHWWIVCAAAAFLLVVTDILYLYDVFGSGQDRSLRLVIHDIWKTLWHSLGSGALAVAYRELIMPLIQLAVLGYFTLLMLLGRRKTQ
jgi:hypothetical protein